MWPVRGDIVRWWLVSWPLEPTSTVPLTPTERGRHQHKSSEICTCMLSRKTLLLIGTAVCMLTVCEEDFLSLRPIHLAAHRGHSSIIIELLRSIQTYQYSCFLNNSLKLLIPGVFLDFVYNYRRGCSPDIDRASDGLTALMLAAEADHTQCCRLLVESGANTSLTENGVQR